VEDLSGAEQVKSAGNRVRQGRFSRGTEGRRNGEASREGCSCLQEITTGKSRRASPEMCVTGRSNARPDVSLQLRNGMGYQGLTNHRSTPK